MNISCLVTTHNEGKCLWQLFPALHKANIFSEIIVLDDNSTCPFTLAGIKNEKVFKHSLNNDYGEHKNYGIQQCSGDYIFQLDGDEQLAEWVLDTIPELLLDNPSIELFWFPRLNDFQGVTPEHAATWGWHLSEVHGKQVVNWNSGDYQGRLFKRHYPRIKFEGRLHERINGHTSFAYLPKEPEYAIIHSKTIGKQIETNLRYNKQFTLQENMGNLIT